MHKNLREALFQILFRLVHQMFLTAQGVHHMIWGFSKEPPEQFNTAVAPCRPQDGRRSSKSDSSLLCTQPIST